jgi:uncharacterized protein YqhQ
MSAPSPQAVRPYIGGQAVLEGVMMRAPTSFAVVVRRRDGSLVVRERAMRDEKRGAGKVPLLRGLVSLVESLKLGSEALRFSAERLEEDILAEEKAARAAGPVSRMLSALGLTLFSLATTDGTEKAGEPVPVGEGKRAGKGPMGLMLVVAIAFLIALPQGAASGIKWLFNLHVELQSPGFQVLTGTFKLLIVVGYLLLIRRVPDIRRVFQYHGAEHKTISTYEANEPLDVAHARTKTTLHPRCGTTFIVMVALVSVLVFTAVGAFLPRIHTGNALLDNVIFFLEKLPFLPPLIAVTFEVQRAFARYCTRGPLRALLWPGFLVQKITTIEPADDQLEVALAALSATLFRERARGASSLVSNNDEGDVTFPSYEAMAAADKLRAA